MSKPPAPDDARDADRDEHSSDENSSGPALNASGIAGIERAFLRLTFWQTLLSLAGVFTGAVALYAALNESQAVRQQTAASVWPYMQLITYDSATEEQARFSLQFSNVGVGPARMRAMQVVVNGEAVGSWAELIADQLEAPVHLGKDYGKSDVSRRVLAPGETVSAFQTEHRELALAMQRAIGGGEAGIRYCYCSIFDECWIKDTLEVPLDAEPARTEQCPDFGAAAFRN